MFGCKLSKLLRPCCQKWVGVAVTPLIRIQEVISSNLSRNIVYRNYRFSWSSSLLPSLNSSIIRRYIVQLRQKSLNNPQTNKIDIRKKSGSRKPRLTATGIRFADPLYPQKLALTSPTSGFRSVAIVRLRTKATEFF
jgi:hypothetical protein